MHATPRRPKHAPLDQNNSVSFLNDLGGPLRELKFTFNKLITMA
jgi:hypothetical protein